MIACDECDSWYHAACLGQKKAILEAQVRYQHFDLELYQVSLGNDNFRFWIILTFSINYVSFSSIGIAHCALAIPTLSCTRNEHLGAPLKFMTMSALGWEAIQ